MKHNKREMARKLRSDLGLSIKVIGKRLGVAYSTVGLWVRDVSLTVSQRIKLQEKIGKAGGVATKRRWENLKAPWKNKAKTLLTERWWAIVAALYWAEGTRRGNDASISNSEASLLRVFVTASRRLFPEARIIFRLSLPLRMGDDKSFKLWWEKELGRPSRWWKTIRPRTSGKRLIQAYKGTLQVNVLDYRFRTMLMAAVAALQQESLNIPVA